MGRDGEHRHVTFDPLEYVASNTDLITAIGANSDAASTHYIEHGRAEIRKIDSFDAAQDLANYGDLRAAFGNDQHAATMHYIAHGFAEHRNDDPHGGAAAADFLL